MDRPFLRYKQKGDYHWRDFEEEGEYRNHVLKVIDWIKEKGVLDIGCGDGLITSKIGAVGIDTDEEGIRLAQEHGVPSSVCSAYSVEGTYPAVFIGDTLEHVEFPDKVVENVKKLTNIVYIAVPTEREEIDYTSWSSEILREFMTSRGWKELENEVANKRIYGKYIFDNNLHVLRTKRAHTKHSQRKAPVSKSRNSR